MVVHSSVNRSCLLVAAAAAAAAWQLTDQFGWTRLSIRTRDAANYYLRNQMQIRWLSISRRANDLNKQTVVRNSHNMCSNRIAIFCAHRVRLELDMFGRSKFAVFTGWCGPVSQTVGDSGREANVNSDRQDIRCQYDSRWRTSAGRLAYVYVRACGKR